MADQDEESIGGAVARGFRQGATSTSASAAKGAAVVSRAFGGAKPSDAALPVGRDVGKTAGFGLAKLPGED
jgi:hypothetical protein